jgi:hypothetical protein
MEKKSAIVVSCLILVTMLIAAIPKVPVAYANGTFLKIVSDVTELGPDDEVGTTFTIKCRVENTTNFYGADIQIGWTTEYIEYVSHIKKIPVNTYPDGILYTPTIGVKDEVDETASMPGSEPGTMYWLSEASMLPAASFNGTGTAFEMTFIVKKHPLMVDSHIYVNITGAILSDKDGVPITHTQVNLDILLHGRLQPAGPEIKISSAPPYRGEVPYTFDTNVSISNLDPYWDLGGFDIKLSFCPEVMQATNLIIDPDNWFSSFWNTTTIIISETDNTLGIVWVVLLGIPIEGGNHTEPFGNATLFTVTFEAYASGLLEKIDDPYSLAAFPHPERSESPFNNSEWSVPIPYSKTDGFADIIGVTEHTLLSTHTVITESNSWVSSIFFSPNVPMLFFNVTGCKGYTGFCNVTIPKTFMWNVTSPGWYVLVDGKMITPTITSDETNTYVYFTYEHSKHSITIITTSVVPEFGLTAIAILLLAALAIALTKKMVVSKNK